ncbi:MAG: hypothetical protein C0483_10095 [Pirellula sp.]|nr:hypothetical protein [Pirellula sp.]
MTPGPIMALTEEKLAEHDPTVIAAPTSSPDAAIPLRRISTPSTQPVPGKSGFRMRELDFLRGVAILLVLGHHAIPMDCGTLAPAAWFWHRIGWTGVDLFFVLSGLLVGGLLLDEVRTHGNIQLKRFYVRRLFKIWPLYYIYLVAATLSKVNRVDPLSTTLSTVTPNYLHVQNYLGTPFKHTWSLAVEEHFYLVLPLFLILIASLNSNPKHRLKGLVVSIACIALACFASRLVAVWTGPDYQACHLLTHNRADSLALGVLLAYLLRYHDGTLRLSTRSSWKWGLTAVLCLSCALFFERRSAIVSSGGYLAIAAGYAIVCLLAIKHRDIYGKLERLRIGTPLKYIALIGALSYPIYLFHFGLGQIPAKWLLKRINGHVSPEIEWILVTSIYLVFLTFIGLFLAKVTERPVLAIRDRLFPSRGHISAK